MSTVRTEQPQSGVHKRGEVGDPRFSLCLDGDSARPIKKDSYKFKVEIYIVDIFKILSIKSQTPRKLVSRGKGNEFVHRNGDGPFTSSVQLPQVLHPKKP